MQFRVIKKGEISQKKYTLITLTAIFSALVTSGLFLALLGLNPLEVYLAMVKGAFGTTYRLEQTIVKSIPLVVTSLGIAIAFKMKFWNIGAEGQIMMGAFGASYFALQYPDMSRPLLLVIMMVAAFVGGAIWGLIPAFFKAKWATNETIVTLMMNYVALKWITYLQYGPWKDPNALGFPKIANFTENAILPKIFGVHIGWIIALILVVLIHVFLKHSKKGFEISVLGESYNTARYAGINISKTILIAMLLSGGICGLVGMLQVAGVSKTLSVEISGGVGYTAIITTWLAALKAPWIVIVSFLFAALIQGSSFIQTAFGISAASALLLEAMILFFVLGSEFFTRYRVVLEYKLPFKKKEES
ncbi:MAG: ABC transporter permease [Eubacteriales bacterium]